METIKYYSQKQVAEILGVHPRTIARWMLEGKLKGAKLGKAWKISSNDINEFYERTKKESAKAIKERSKTT